MGEFWKRIREPDGPATWEHTYQICDTVKQAASAAHIYGKALCQAEAFTSMGPNWEEDLFDLKDIGDRAFCAGLTRNVLCFYVHQARLDVKPGYQWEAAGTHFDRNITWWPQIHAWSERNSGGQDPDFSSGYSEDASNATIEMAMYAIGLAQQRRAEPRDDLTTLMLSMELDGESMTDIQFGSFFVQLVTAGNDTTRTMLSSGLLALLDHPEQLAELRADPALIPGTVEEILRWANPLHYFRRTATRDAQLGGVKIAEGQKVGMIYTSANRDAAVFRDPHRFDIHRDPNPHLSFGTGEHFCLGVHLARLEGRVFFE
jgi:hypothetical protein